jgi:hypothetical protein
MRLVLLCYIIQCEGRFDLITSLVEIKFHFTISTLRRSLGNRVRKKYGSECTDNDKYCSSSEFIRRSRYKKIFLADTALRNKPTY